MNLVAGFVADLIAAGIANVCAHRRWYDPQPNSSVVVVVNESSWSSGSHSGEFPLVKVLIYSAPTDDQDDAEQVGLTVADTIRRHLHVTDGHTRTWGDVRVIASHHVGSALMEVQGHESWRLRTQTFEVQTG